MEISTAAIKALREKSSAGVMDCKRALLEAEGDLERASEILRQRGLDIAAKKKDRLAQEGLIDVYIHSGGRLGAMVEVNCETDFVARTEEFRQLAHEIAMQVAAMSPQYIAAEELPKDETDSQEACLLLQPFIKDPSKTIQDLITETVATVGENIKVRRFVRFELGN